MKYRVISKIKFGKNVFKIQYRKNWFYYWQTLVGFRGPIEFSSLKGAITRVVERRKEITERNKINEEKWKVVWKS